MFSRASLLFIALLAASSAHARSDLAGRWVVGVDLGELPWQGSFKPGLTLHYHLSDYVQIGGIVQIPDAIERDDTSFNASAIGLTGLVDSRETVGARALLHARLRPHVRAPFVSAGLVFNGTDTETTRFDARSRQVGAGEYTGAITVTQSRPWAITPALGLGYGYTFDNGIELSTEWTGAIYAPPPHPEITINGVGDVADLQTLSAQVDRAFRDSPFNLYHIFHLGLGYAF